MAPTLDTKEKRLLRKAAYWLRDYADAFRSAPESGAVAFRKKLLKLATECRKHGR